MPEPKTERSKPAAPPAAPALRPAGESTDPEVHRLLAELQTARLNGDTAAAATLTDAIVACGYTA